MPRPPPSPEIVAVVIVGVGVTVAATAVVVVVVAVAVVVIEVVDDNSMMCTPGGIEVAEVAVAGSGVLICSLKMLFTPGF